MLFNTTPPINKPAEIKKDPAPTKTMSQLQIEQMRSLHLVFKIFIGLGLNVKDIGFTTTKNYNLPIPIITVKEVLTQDRLEKLSQIFGDVFDFMVVKDGEGKTYIMRNVAELPDGPQAKK